jgi:hypothetical protein
MKISEEQNKNKVQGRPFNASSIRGQIFSLVPNSMVSFPICKRSYIRSVAYDISSAYGRKHQLSTDRTNGLIKVIRLS